MIGPYRGEHDPGATRCAGHVLRHVGRRMGWSRPAARSRRARLAEYADGPGPGLVPRYPDTRFPRRAIGVVCCARGCTGDRRTGRVVVHQRNCGHSLPRVGRRSTSVRRADGGADRRSSARVARRRRAADDRADQLVRRCRAVVPRSRRATGRAKGNVALDRLQRVGARGRRQAGAGTSQPSVPGAARWASRIFAGRGTRRAPLAAPRRRHRPTRPSGGVARV